MRRVHKAAFVVVGLIMLALLLGRRAAERPRAVAYAAGEAVTTEAFKRAYASYLLASGVPDELRLRHAFLEDMIGARLMIREAYAEGIAQTPAYAARQAVVARKLLIEAYVQQTVLDTVTASEAEVREAFARSQTQVTARHLYARTRKRADALRARLQDGETFKSLAQEVFTDSLLRSSGGLLPPFTFDEMDVAFEDAAFTLPLGTVSEPVKTAQGYSILRVESRFTKPIITEQEFLAKRPRFEMYVLGKKHTQAKSALVEQIAAENRVSLLEPGAEVLLGQISGTRIAESGDPTFLSMPLLKYAAVQWTVEDFRDRARYASDRQRAAVRTREDLRAFAQGLVVNEQMALRAAQLGLGDTKDYASSLAHAMDAFVLEQARAAVDVAAAVHEDSMRAYYDRAAPGEFMHAAAVALAVRTFDTEAAARAHLHVEAFANAGKDFYTRRELGPWGDAAFSAKEGAILGPYKRAEGFLVLQVGKQRAVVPKSYEESRDEIRAMLHSQAVRRARRVAYADLKRRHKITVDIAQLSELSLQ